MDVIFLKRALRVCRKHLEKIDAGSKECSELIDEMIEPSLRKLNRTRWPQACQGQAERAASAWSRCCEKTGR